MKHLLLLVIVLLMGSHTIKTQAESSPIKLSVVKKNKGKIVRSIILAPTSISAYIENKTLHINRSIAPYDISISIYDKNNVLLYQATINPINNLSIDISKWKTGEYSIVLTNQSDLYLIGNFHIEQVIAYN